MSAFPNLKAHQVFSKMKLDAIAEEESCWNALG